MNAHKIHEKHTQFFGIVAINRCISGNIFQVKDITFRVKIDPGTHRAKVIWVMLFAQPCYEATQKNLLKFTQMKDVLLVPFVRVKNSTFRDLNS